MGISLSKDDAIRVLIRAHSLAIDPSVSLPEHWADVTRQIGDSPSRTFVAGLGAALLAKATDERVDPLSIKAAYSDRAFSLRTLCHGVLVPHSREADPPYHLGVTGREPLNNQPYFRYDHLDRVDRVRRSSLPYLAILKRELRHVDDMTSTQACDALAAFLRERVLEYQTIQESERRETPETKQLASLRRALVAFLGEGQTERPHRLQATVAGIVSCVSNIQPSLQRLNDPSRRAPGDVHVPATSPHFVAEVRGKPVPQHEAEEFVRSCGRAGIGIAWLVVLDQSHGPIDRDALLDVGLQFDVLPVVLESIDELLTASIGIPSHDLDAVLSRVGLAVARALRSAGALAATVDEWIRLLSDD
ncbi:restriction endonuclease, SacI family [Candidatus Poriferisodalis sp.]|uniref:restriction endonuclease, SacI family n=1 Tax=Candidatus Poriferisodalis sp. TaxID=3101277 RepID=UPI003B02D559